MTYSTRKPIANALKKPVGPAAHAPKRSLMPHTANKGFLPLPSADGNQPEAQSTTPGTSEGSQTLESITPAQLPVQNDLNVITAPSDSLDNAGRLSATANHASTNYISMPSRPPGATEQPLYNTIDPQLLQEMWRAIRESLARQRVIAEVQRARPQKKPRKKRTCMKCGLNTCKGKNGREKCPRLCQDCQRPECNGRNSKKPDLPCNLGWL